MPLGVASSEEYLSLYSVNKVTMALLMQPERNADGSIALFKTRSPWNHAEAYERSQGCRVRFDRVASFIHRHPAAASTSETPQLVVYTFNISWTGRCLSSLDAAS